MVLICISMIMSDVKYLFSVHIGHSVSSLGHLKIRLFVGNSQQFSGQDLVLSLMQPGFHPWLGN